MSVLSDTLHAANGNEETASKVDMCPRRLSRVSRLRDMFQTGVVKPIDDTEDGFDVESSVFSAYTCPDFERFSRLVLWFFRLLDECSCEMCCWTFCPKSF